MTKEVENIVLLENISLGYGNKELLSIAGATLRKGEMIALAGSNGSGKSTLLRTIARIQQARKGSIRLLGKEISSYNQKELARMIAFVGTVTDLSEDLTVFELVSLGRHPYTNWWGSITKSDRNEIENSIHFVGMGNYNGVKVSRLSDGERQLVMIARALAQDSRIIVLDEPTAFLDIPNKLKTIEVLYRLRSEGKSIIFSSHDFDTLFQYADKLWLIKDRKLLQGAPEDLGLTGSYDSLFDNDNLKFEAEELKFRKQKNKVGVVFVDINDRLTDLWTRRALERSGYKVAKDYEEGTLKISVVIQNNKAVWKESIKNREFSSLYELITYLTQVK